MQATGLSVDLVGILAMLLSSIFQVSGMLFCVSTPLVKFQNFWASACSPST